MEKTYKQEQAVNCKNCSSLIRCGSYYSKSSGTKYARYKCIENDYTFNSRNVPLQKPCERFNPTLLYLIKYYLKKLFKLF